MKRKTLLFSIDLADALAVAGIAVAVDGSLVLSRGLALIMVGGCLVGLSVRLHLRGVR